ncbi:hypothetical protein JCM3765_002440 [Sporobolomyces pararoseus]
MAKSRKLLLFSSLLSLSRHPLFLSLSPPTPPLLLSSTPPPNPTRTSISFPYAYTTNNNNVTAVTDFALDPSLFPPTLHSTATDPSPSITIRERERNQLRVVAQRLAPDSVLDQVLSVPDAPTTFRDCLSSNSKLLTISTLRSCLNQASTNALFSCATSFDLSSPEETTRLLNEVDTFQSTLLGLLDEVEYRYNNKGKGKGKGGVKRELQQQQDDDVSFNKTKKFMLHRGGANRGDLFTSAAFLSEQDLQQISTLTEADLVQVHSTSTSTSTSSTPPAPSLGSLHPPFPPPSTHVPISTRFSLAPGQSPALIPFLPSLIPPIAPKTSSNSTNLQPLVRETRMLDYGIWNGGINGLRFDSQGSTDGGYSRAANRLIGREKLKKWDKELLQTEPLGRIKYNDDDDEEEETFSTTEEKEKMELTMQERKVLQGLEIDLKDYLTFENKFEKDSKKVWKVLESNLELINRLAGQQIARVRKSVKKEEKKRKQEIKKRGTSSTVEGGGGGGTGESEDSSSNLKRDVAEGVEKQDADTLLESLTSLLSSFYQSSILPSTTTTTSPPSLLPSPSLVRSLTPLIVSELHREASYHGSLEPIEGNDLKNGWEKAVKESSSSHSGVGGGGGIKEE